MKTYLNTVLCIFVVFLCACSKPPETLVMGGYDEKEMEEAIVRAKSEVDQFLEVMEKGNGTNFSVKAPIDDDGNVEYFWLTDIIYKDGSFEGLIGNDPGIVTNVSFGQKWTIKKEDIADWMFVRDGLMYGNYTMRPLLKTLPEEGAAYYRSILANP